MISSETSVVPPNERRVEGKKKEKRRKRKGKLRPQERRNASEIGIVKTELYIPPSSPRTTLLDRALY